MMPLVSQATSALAIVIAFPRCRDASPPRIKVSAQRIEFVECLAAQVEVAARDDVADRAQVLGGSAGVELLVGKAASDGGKLLELRIIAEDAGQLRWRVAEVCSGQSCGH